MGLNATDSLINVPLLTSMPPDGMGDCSGAGFNGELASQRPTSIGGKIRKELNEAVVAQTTVRKGGDLVGVMKLMSSELSHHLPHGSGALPPIRPPASPPPAPGLAVSGNTIDTGKYLISASNDDHATLTVTDKTTGQVMTVHGDPHVKLANGYTGDFQREAMHVSLDDGTQLEITTTEMKKNVTYMASVAVSRNGTAARVDFHDGKGTTTAIDNTANTSLHKGDVALDASGGLMHVKVAGKEIAKGSDKNLDHSAGASDSLVGSTQAPAPAVLPAKPAARPAVHLMTIGEALKAVGGLDAFNLHPLHSQDKRKEAQAQEGGSMTTAQLLASVGGPDAFSWHKRQSSEDNN